MMEICNYKLCTGCSACINICPMSCIEFEQSIDLWTYPKIDTERCIKCGKCIEVCQGNADKITINRDERLENPKVFGAILTNQQNLLNSTSGGAFYAIARAVLNQEGVVYGAAMIDFHTKHIRVTSYDKLPMLQGSKYVQSEMGNIYTLVKKDLQDNKKVLFSGTPCQVEGLYRFLNKKYRNLITCDLLCKGVPSPKLFSKYIEFLQKHYSENISDLNFRDKSLGYILLSAIHIKQKKIFLHGIEDSYVKAVGAGYVRESCFSCKFTSEMRVGDISLGDFWHIGEKEKIDKNVNKGCSLVICNTVQGIRILEDIKKIAYVEERSWAEARRSQSSALTHPIKKPSDYEQFNLEATYNDWKSISKKYLRSKSLIGMLRDMLPKRLERKIAETLKRK